MTPTIGRIVHYRLTEDEALKTGKRREDARQQIEQMHSAHAGFQAHVGNPVATGEMVPMIITQVWPDEFGPGTYGVNGQALLDGSDSLWVTSAGQGDEPGQWNWPKREDS
jgi:hypothetical protein